MGTKNRKKTIKKKTSLESLELASNAYLSNEFNIEEVCKIFNVSKSVFYRHLRKNSLKRKHSKQFSLSKEDLEKAASIYESQHISVKEVGKMFGVSSSPILTYLKRNNRLKSREKSRKRKIPLEKHNEIIKEYLEIKNYHKIAKKYNTDANSIKDILKRNEIEIFSPLEKKGIDEKIEADIIRRYINGELRSSIRKLYGITNKEIDFCVRNLRRDRVGRTESLSEEEKLDILKMYKTKKCSSKEIEKKYNLTNKALRDFVKENGVNPKKRDCIQYLSNDDKMELLKMYKDEYLTIDILKKYNLHRRAFKNFIKSQNIEWRESGGLHSMKNISNSSRGISGHYKGHLFRSLKELCFIGQVLMIKYKDNEWRSGENKNDRIKYLKLNNKEGFYYPDFIIKNKIIVEIKPKYLHNDDVVKLKCKAAQIHCSKNNKKFTIIDYQTDLNFVAEEYFKGNLTLTEKEEKRLLKNIQTLNLNKTT